VPKGRSVKSARPGRPAAKAPGLASCLRVCLGEARSQDVSADFLDNGPALSPSHSPSSPTQQNILPSPFPPPSPVAWSIRSSCVSSSFRRPPRRLRPRITGKQDLGRRPCPTERLGSFSCATRCGLSYTRSAKLRSCHPGQLLRRYILIVVCG
jgi:hypothetical protein